MENLNSNRQSDKQTNTQLATRPTNGFFPLTDAFSSTRIPVGAVGMRQTS